MGWRKIAENILLILVMAAPLGTRLIWRSGEVAGSPAEWGTVSLFGTQLLAVLFIVAVVVSRPRWPKATSLLLAPFVIAVLASCAVSGDFWGAWLGAGWWLALAPLVWLAISALRPDATRLTWALVASAAVQAVLGLGQFFAQTVLACKWLGMAAQSPATAGVAVIEAGGERWLRAYGTLPHPNVFGFVCAIGLLAAIFLASRSRHRRLALASVALLAAGLIVSFSRGAWIAAVVGLAVMFSTAKGTRKALARALAVAAVTSALFLVAAPELFLTRLVATGRLEAMSVETRVSSIADGLAVLAAHPLFGAGPGRAVAELAALQPGRVAWLYQPAHFLPLAVADEVGLLGLLALAVVFFAVVRFVWCRGRNPLALGLLVAVATAGLFDHYFWTLWQGKLFFWLLVSLAAVVAQDAHSTST
jgi:O-antigen ligase